MKEKNYNLNFMENENKETKEFTMGIGRVNIIAILFIFPIMVFYILPFKLIWGSETFELGKDLFMKHFFLYLIFGAIIHELLHGITWAFFAKDGIKSIKFGVKWKYLTPYCHCKEPLMVKHYRIGGAMPLIIMGIIPSILGLFIGNGAFLSFGGFFTLAAAGDIIALFMLRTLESDEYISDHPNKMGFIKESRNEEAIHVDYSNENKQF